MSREIEPRSAGLVDANPFVEATAEHRVRGGGDQWIFRFANGFGASVIQSPYSYGSAQGLYEMAVTVTTGPGMNDFDITYDTPITDDVLGYQSTEEIRAALLAVAELPSAIGYVPTGTAAIS